MLVLASQMQEQEVIRIEFKAEEGMQCKNWKNFGRGP